MKRILVALPAATAAIVYSRLAHASFLPPELMDAAADYIALFVLFAVPIGAIALFWLVHVLPEKIAEKRHHPQKDAVKTLCLLSLVFGGMLWPLAWLWAYTKPVAYRMAYGTDKHDDYFREMEHKAKDGALSGSEIENLRHELDAMAERGALPPALQALREILARPAAPAAGASAGTETKE